MSQEFDENGDTQTGRGLGLKAAGLATALGAGAALAGCATTGGGQQTPSAFEAAAGQALSPEHMYYSPTVLALNTADTLYGDNVDFFWSATCIYSAQTYAERIFALMRNNTAAKKTNFVLNQICRDEHDLKFFVKMRRYVEYDRLCSGWLRTTASRGRVMSLEDVDGLARHMRLTPRKDYKESLAADLGRSYNQYFRQELKILQTPTVKLNNRIIKFS